MTEKSQAEFEQLHQSVVTYGKFAIQMLRESIDAFESQDSQKAQQVTMQKLELKAMFVPIEESLFQYITLYNPVARDMREIVASIRIIYYLERIGRMGFDISQTTIILSQCCGLRESPALVEMGRLVIHMIEDTISAFEERKTTKILSMQDRDNEVDSLYCKVLTDLIRKMQNEKDNIPILARYVIVDRYLERCGDQACNMAEMILYMITGERIEIHS